MDLISLVIALLILGVGLYYINVKVPMQSTLNKLLNFAVILFAVLLILQAFGLLDSVRNLRLR